MLERVYRVLAAVSIGCAGAYAALGCWGRCAVYVLACAGWAYAAHQRACIVANDAEIAKLRRLG